jgi:hypothetical protein
MLCKITGASQPVFRTAVFTAVFVGVIEQPVNTLFNRFTMDTHAHPPAVILLFAGNQRIHYFSDTLHAAQIEAWFTGLTELAPTASVCQISHSK